MLPNVSFYPPSHASFYTPFVPSQGFHTVSHCLIHFTAKSTFTFGLSLVYFCFYCDCPNCHSCAPIISDSVSLLYSHLLAIAIFLPLKFLQFGWQLLLFQHTTLLISSPFLKASVRYFLSSFYFFTK